MDRRGPDAPRIGIRAFHAACILLLAGGAVRAQVPGGARPDVYVLVMAHPSGQWVVSAIYPKVVPRTTMQAHLQRLLSLSGWNANSVRYETRGLQKNNGNLNLKPLAPGGRDPAMSSVTFLSKSPIVDRKGATLPVEPFARAFRDLNRVYLTFFVSGSFPFRGLRHHSDANLEMALSEQSGAYTYVLHIMNHDLRGLNLPRRELVSPRADVRAASSAANRVRLVGTGLAVLLAAAGLFAYSWAHRWSGR